MISLSILIQLFNKLGYYSLFKSILIAFSQLTFKSFIFTAI